jgi:hypothetical protein
MLVDERATEAAEPAETSARRAYWPIALLLGGLVIAMLGAAFLLDQRFRPRVGIEPAPAIADVATPAVAVAPTIAAAPTVLPTQPPAPTAIPTAPPTAMPTAAAPTPASAPGALPPNATDLLSPLHREIIDAYLRYWDVRSHAYYDLDTSRLSEVMAGDELARAEQSIRELKAQGRAGKWDVEHNFRILKAAPDEAVIYDEYVNNSVFVDAVTKQEIPTSEPPMLRKISFEMKKIDGRWKVIDGTRHD